MTIFKQRRDGRVVKAPACNPGFAGSIPAHVSSFPTGGADSGVKAVLKTVGFLTKGQGSIPSPPAIFKRIAGHGVWRWIPNPRLAGSTPARCAIFRTVTRTGARSRLLNGVLFQRRVGIVPSAVRHFMRVRLLLVVGRRIVNPLIRNAGGSIPPARTILS